MATGFLEGRYSVEQRVERVIGKGTQLFELRREPLGWPGYILPDYHTDNAEREPMLPLYIALFGKTPDGHTSIDSLLFYANGAEEVLRTDWIQLTTELDVHIEDLGWEHHISFHSAGYGKRGSFAIY